MIGQNHPPNYKKSLKHSSSFIIPTVINDYTDHYSFSSSQQCLAWFHLRILEIYTFKMFSRNIWFLPKTNQKMFYFGDKCATRNVVNALLHNGLLNPYLSRYNSISLCYQCQTGHSLVNYQCQTNGHDLISYQCQHRHKLVIYQSQTNGHNLVSYQCRTDTSL